MTYHESVTLLTATYNAMLIITDSVARAVEKRGIQNGLVTVVSRHTTTGIAVNEALECLESDIDGFLGRLAPEDFPYAHARMLKDYGSTAGNPTGHLKAHVTGNHCHMPVADGRILKGGAQEIYFCEFDGPASRTYDIVVMGD